MLIDGDVSKSYETYHSCPCDPIQLTFVWAKFLQIAFKQSRPRPPVGLDPYISILFIKCV